MAEPLMSVSRCPEHVYYRRTHVLSAHRTLLTTLGSMPSGLTGTERGAYFEAAYATFRADAAPDVFATTGQ